MKQVKNTLRIISSAILTVLFLLVTSAAQAQGDAKAGEGIFKAKCASCHNMTKDVTGPALIGVLDRVPSRDWLKSWIKDNVALRGSGDAYANKIYNQWGGAAMSQFAYFSDADLENVVEYISTYEKPGDVGTPDLLPCIPAQKKDEESSYFLFGVIGLSLLIIVIFTGVNRSLKNAKAVKEGGEASDPKSAGEAIGEFAVKNKIKFGLIVLFIVGGLASLGWNFHMSIGIFGGNGIGKTADIENYHPTQPIEFRHDIHAKQNEIDCKYCHSGTIEGKHALIPSANVCMNCHKTVSSKEDCEVSTEKIQKIYDAVNFEPKKGYFEVVNGEKVKDAQGNVVYHDEQVGEGNPIEWVKVHNLQDFVYFNHSQHVVVGNVDCKECHGDVENGTTAEHFAPLTMGWCIECHRTKEINEEMKFSGKPNGYYEKMHNEFKEAYKHQEEFNFTVEKIGGLECAKCHY